MAFTQSQIDELRDLYRQGIRSVSINGRAVTYATMAEMWAAILKMEAEVNAPSIVNRPNVRRIGYKEPI
ncbi:MAG: hypothetical protein A2Y38_19280 [Spirochaetes bacterium GWB1_59_5]|nr:MAG: hypothetical protein A2Y38_19280 [Spirochaetes bacterium GWB1_59_5]